jgi:hypothetical protein
MVEQEGPVDPASGDLLLHPFGHRSHGVPHHVGAKHVGAKKAGRTMRRWRVSPVAQQLAAEQLRDHLAANDVGNQPSKAFRSIRQGGRDGSSGRETAYNSTSFRFRLNYASGRARRQEGDFAVPARFLRGVSPALLAAILFASPVAAEPSDFEPPPILDARDIAGDVPPVGDHYSVRETVPTDGFMATVTILSPFGEFSASGPGMLAARVNEIRALAALDAIESDEQFKAAAGDKARDTAGNLRTLAEHPGETLKGVPEGVGRFFNRTGRSLKTGVQKLDDVRQGRLPGVDQDTLSSLPGGPSEPVAEPQGGLVGTIARAGGDVAVNVLGFDEQRRRLAKELAVDPYTTNAVLSARLDDVTWAAFAGGLGVNLVTSMIPGGMIVSASSQLTNWVWDTAPGDLRVQIETTLLGIGAGREEIDRFLRHHWYTLSMQTVLASSLAALDGVEARADVLPLALSVGSEGQARFVVQTLDMLKQYHVLQEPLSALVVEGTVVGRTQSGANIVMAPVDYLSWSPVLSRFASRLDDGSDQVRTLHIAGRATDRAREELEQLGWTVTEESALAPVAYPLR